LDLAQFLKTEPRLSLYEAGKHQNQTLDFLRRSPMQVSGLELLYDRSPDFQKLLEYRARDFVTVLSRNTQGAVDGLVSFTTDTYYVDGRQKACTYIGDFRAEHSRSMVALWRRVYSGLLLALRNSAVEPCYYFTSILANNRAAIRNLAETRQDYGFQYDPIGRVTMVNVYARYWKRLSSASMVSFATVADEEVLREFLDQCERRKLFGRVFDRSQSDEWIRRLRLWPGFRIENFLLLRDAAGQILACTLPWSPSAAGAKSMRVLKAPTYLKRTFEILKHLGFNFPVVGQELRTTYLTHLCFAEGIDRAAAVSGFLDCVLMMPKTDRPQMVSFAANFPLGRKFWRFLYQTIPVALFRVRLSHEKPISFGSQEVGFEMELV
jgi:hypothetical protein